MPTLLRLCSCLAAAALAAGCRDTPTEPGDGLRVSVAVPVRQLRAGESTAIVILVRNEGTRTQRVDFVSPCSGPFALIAADGSRASPAPHSCAVSLIARSAPEVAPGREITFTGFLRAAGERLPATYGVFVVTARPGEYTVRPEVHAIGESRAVPLSAEPVSVRVLD